MDKRTTGIIATVASVVLCGCPGLLLCIIGLWGATGTLPYSTTVNDVTNTGNLPPTAGFVMLCLALIFIAIPVVVGILMLRNRPAAPATPPAPDNQPLPPPS